MKQIHITVGRCREGEALADFSVMLPMESGYFTEYRFSYLKHGANPTLSFDKDIGGSTNCELYRICGAYVTALENGEFARRFRVLQGGEVSFALREVGAADFVGGIHGDENMTDACLYADGVKIPLDKEGHYCCSAAELDEASYINRCNTPEQRILLHKQKYTFSNGEIILSQYLEWLSEPRAIDRAFTPMLTVQRRCAEDSSRILTDTVEFYSYEKSEPFAVFDTSAYGTVPNPALPPRLGVGSRATGAAVYGKNSGLRAEVCILGVGGELDTDDVAAHIWLRYGESLDSKIYFNVHSDEKTVRRGTVWELNIKYRIEYLPSEE